MDLKATLLVGLHLLAVDQLGGDHEIKRFQIVEAQRQALARWEARPKDRDLVADSIGILRHAGLRPVVSEGIRAQGTDAYHRDRRLANAEWRVQTRAGRVCHQGPVAPRLACERQLEQDNADAIPLVLDRYLPGSDELTAWIVQCDVDGAACWKSPKTDLAKVIPCYVHLCCGQQLSRRCHAAKRDVTVSAEADEQLLLEIVEHPPT